VSTLAIELNDAGITALGDDERAASEGFASPGYAVVDGASVVIGAEALALARLKPRRVHHRFWSQLDTQPIGRPFPADLSPADLAHAHLLSVWERFRDGVDRVVIALPGSHSDQQMGLILGIAQACGMPVEGIVDAAVAAAATVSPSGHVLHLDLELNGIVLTEMTSAPGRRSHRMGPPPRRLGQARRAQLRQPNAFRSVARGHDRVRTPRPVGRVAPTSVPAVAWVGAARGRRPHSHRRDRT